jgi:hypothetical protein
MTRFSQVNCLATGQVFPRIQDNYGRSLFNHVPRSEAGAPILPGPTNGASRGIGIALWKSRQHGCNPFSVGMLLLNSLGTSSMIFESIFGAQNMTM